ncbi:MAG TPA: hypothetical protein VF183_11740 [Acidimicrobiales bacterium]
MTVTRGQPWGELGPLPDDGVIVRSDAEAAAVVAAARAAGEAPPPVGLLGGDLCRTLGGRGDEARLHTPDAARLVVDVLLVRLDDGDERVAVAHVIVRGRTWLHGPIDAVMNAAWMGEWNVAPRAHPNDGMADVVHADLSLGDRFKARSRLPLGTHVPHPGIRTTRNDTVRIESRRTRRVWIDGVAAGAARRVEVRLEPDALRVVV